MPGHRSSTPSTAPGAPREAGFSLVEVLFALAVLGVVMLSISGLFVQAANSIKGGKEMTEALAQGSNILEDLERMSAKRLYQIFGAADTDAVFAADTRTNAFASRWQPEIDEALWNGHATLQLTPIGGAVAPPTFASAKGVRLLVTLHWEERGVGQQLRLVSVRF